MYPEAKLYSLFTFSPDLPPNKYVLFVNMQNGRGKTEDAVLPLLVCTLVSRPLPSGGDPTDGSLSMNVSGF